MLRLTTFSTPASALCLLLACAPSAHGVSCSKRTAPMSPGDIAMSHNNYAEAETLYAKESQAAGTDGDRAHAALIRARLRQSKLAVAEKDALDWSTAQPSNVWSLVALGEVQWREGKDDQAARTLNKARALDICNPQVHADMSNILRMAGLYATANREITLARALDPVDDDIESSWMGLQPRAVQLQEVTAYLSRSSFLSDSERKSLTSWKDRLSQPAASGCHLASQLSTTSIPFRGIQDGPDAPTYWGLNVSFDGKPRRLEIDTGASGLILTKSAAAALHLEPEATFKSSGIGDEGDVNSFVARVKSIRIGDLEFQDCDVQVLGTNPKAMQAQDGLIGGDVFAQFLLTLDFPGRILKLAPLPARPGDANAGGPSLQTGVSADNGVAKDAFRDPSMKDWDPVWRSGHDLIIPVFLNQGPRKLFIIDTGSQTDLISPDAAREVVKVSKGSDADIYGISGQVKKTFTTGPLKLQFANIVAPNYGLTAIDTSSLGKSAGMEISGLIGSPTLHQLTMTIDYRDNLIHFVFDPKRITRCVGDVHVADCY